MSYYRLYFLDQSSHIKGVLEIEAANDDIAASIAEREADGRAFELWHNDRMLVRQWFENAAAC